MGGDYFIEGFHFFSGGKEEFPSLVFPGAGLICVLHSGKVLNAGPWYRTAASGQKIKNGPAFPVAFRLV